MKLISWNVNGIRACIKKGFLDFFASVDADIVCVQETKAEPSQVEIDLGGQYFDYWNSAEKKGYSGTAVFTRIPPVSVSYGIEDENTENPGEYDREGRVITLKFSASSTDKPTASSTTAPTASPVASPTGKPGSGFYLVNVYTPNSGQELARLDYRLCWEDAFREYICRLDKEAPVIICGDLNVAHREIDIANPKTNEHSAGYTKQERGKFQELLDTGFTDTYRHFYPDKREAYTWWSYMRGLRERNIGWRIDYFLCSQKLTAAVKDAFILPDIQGSDHCPVGILIEN